MKSFYNVRHQHAVRRDTAHIPSAPDTGCNTAVRASKTYSGSVVIGIATMHKSNLVPVTSGIGTNPKITG